jgi:serine/threonine protein kinase
VAKLRHEYIIRDYEMYVDETNHRLYIVMEYFDGITLNEAIAKSRNGRLSERAAGTIFKLLMKAVDYLHQHGVCHRDLHPDNILVSRCNIMHRRNSSHFLALDQLRIIDFNVSKYFGTSYDYLEQEELDSSLVKMLTITGNKLYSAPEMLRGGGYKYITTHSSAVKS